MGLEEHRRESPAAVRFAVITISDTRDVGTDRGGAYLVETITAAGHEVAWRTIVKDESVEVERAVREAVGRADVDLVLTTGGTGIAPRDVTLHVDGDVRTFRRLFPRIVCAWSEERSIATSCFPRWMLISWVGAIMLRTTTVLNFALNGPQ